MDQNWKYYLWDMAAVIGNVPFNSLIKLTNLLFKLMMSKHLSLHYLFTMYQKMDNEISFVENRYNAQNGFS